MRARRTDYMARDAWFATLYEDPRHRLASAEDVVASMEQAGVDRTVVLGFPWRDGGLCKEHNNYLIEAVRKYPDKLIGFAKLTIDDTYTQSGLMNIVSLIQHRDKAPTNALIAQAVRSCAERKIAYLVYSSFSYGNKRQDSLSDFKERNGFKKVDIPRYYVPLTPVGSIAFRFRLHHTRVVDYLPERVIARLRQFRTAWYARRFPTDG